MTSYLKSNNSAEGVPDENNWLFMALIEAFVLIENALNQWSDMLNGCLIRSDGASRVVNADDGKNPGFRERSELLRNPEARGRERRAAPSSCKLAPNSMNLSTYNTIRCLTNNNITGTGQFIIIIITATTITPPTIIIN